MIQRHGSTLIEMILSMVAGSGVMLLAMSLLHQSLLLSEKSSNRADTNRTLDRLSYCFRRDLWTAKQWSIGPDGTLTVTGSDDSQVTYTTHSHAVTREGRKGANEIERERFALSEDATATFESMRDPVRVALVVSNSKGLDGPESGNDQTRLDLTVECLPGRTWIHERNSGVQP